MPCLVTLHDSEPTSTRFVGSAMVAMLAPDCSVIWMFLSTLKGLAYGISVPPTAAARSSICPSMSGGIHGHDELPQRPARSAGAKGHAGLVDGRWVFQGFGEIFAED